MKKIIFVVTVCIGISACSLHMRNPKQKDQQLMATTEQPNPTTTLNPTVTNFQISSPDWTRTPTPSVIPTLLPINKIPFIPEEWIYLPFQKDAILSKTAIGPDFVIWGLIKNGIASFENGEWRTYYYPQDYVRNGSPSEIEVDSDGTVWIGTTNGIILRFMNNTWSKYSIPEDYAESTYGSSINALLIDNENILWIGVSPGLSFIHNNALYSLNEGKWQAFPNEDLLGSSMVQTIVSDSVGEIWLGAENGLVHLNGNDWISFPASMFWDELACGGIATMEIASDNHIWLITRCGKRLVRFDGINYVDYTIPTFMSWEGVFEVDSNKVWIGGGENDRIEFTSALAYFDGMTWTYFEDLPFDMVFNIFRLSNESLLIEAVTGLYLYTPQ
jgi:ligand-binding sensor domain-containing protein